MHAHSQQNPFSDQKPIPGIRHVVVVASGKGGVGKSSVAVNLAVALAKNHKVGLLDADIYGPSLPRMMGAIGQRPVSNEENKIIPLTRYGVKVMSIGFLVEDTASVIWRGPMLFKAIDQFLNDVEWGELDYLIVDLPPGTGDVQLTLAQKIPITGALIVSTPQNIALVDVKKAVDMFQRTQVPILGVIENMAYMRNPTTGESIQLFPKGDIDSFLEENSLLKLGEIPFHPHIALSCEIGVPVLSQSSLENVKVEAQEFYDICEHIDDILSDTPAPQAMSAGAPAAEKTSGGCSHGGCTCR